MPEVLGDPALDGVALAVLFLALAGQLGVVGGGVVLGLDELGHEGDDAVVAVGDDGGADHGVEVLGRLGLADMAGGAVLAMDLAGLAELDAIQRDEVRRLSRRRKGARAPLSARVSRQAGKRASKASVGQPSSRDLMQLSEGMRSMPNRDWQLERASVSCMRRWKARKEGSCMKKGARAEQAASAKE